MALGIRVGVFAGEHLLFRHALEGLQQAARALSGGTQVFECGPVGCGFFAALIGQERPLADGSRAHDHSATARSNLTGSGGRPGCRGPRTENHADDRDDLGIGGSGTQAHEMTTGDVARFMGNHANHFTGCFRFHDDTDVDEHPAAVGNESVEALVVDQNDFRF